jgi:hypothetical protein
MVQFILFIVAFASTLPVKSGDLSVSVSADGQKLIVARKNKTDDIFNIVGRCGAPSVGEPKIRDVNVTLDLVNVTYGKHCHAQLSLKTSRLNCSGCD